MAFQIKDFASITASAINWMKSTTQKVTDFNIGSVVRTMIEACAAEIDELYQQMFIGLKEAIPVSVYNSFGFPAIVAVPASGIIRVTITSSASPTIISAQTVFTTTGQAVTYANASDVTIAPGGTYADIQVTAQTPGVAGNLAAGKAFTMTPTPTGLVSASNTAAFINGVDQETDEQRKVRFNAFIASLNRGTLAALHYGALSTVLYDASGNEIERVASAAIIEPWLLDNTQPISLINVYIHNGAGSTSSNLVNKVNAVLYGYYDADGTAHPGWKAAGVKVNVFAAAETLVNVTGVVTVFPGYDGATQVAAAQAAIANYILSLPIGKNAILSEIIALVMGIDGVYNFVVSAPTADVTVANNVKLMPGTIAAGPAVILVASSDALTSGGYSIMV